MNVVECTAHGGEGECDRGNIEEIAEEIDAKGDRLAEKVVAGVVLVDFRNDDDGVTEMDEAKGSRCGERKVARVVKQEEDEENVGGEGTAQDGEWDENMECVKADDAEVMDDVNDVEHVEGVKPEIAESTPVYAERVNNGKYKDEEEDRDYRQEAYYDYSGLT
ncbi:hypothetical protein HPB52_000396 [Rhipicephalus sanguineus]|uniref:Uncharacterized protein n=1 Tax=Rhipicephalus sanguineus TaxID=34632 RepID=A0A9D4SN87_RHISA|nr:hypothetical protein HPB52_000396 [Rhipicephalus sanguineus]